MSGKNHQTDSQARKVVDAKEAAAIARQQAEPKKDEVPGVPTRQKAAMTGAPEKK